MTTGAAGGGACDPMDAAVGVRGIDGKPCLVVLEELMELLWLLVGLIILHQTFLSFPSAPLSIPSTMFPHTGAN